MTPEQKQLTDHILNSERKSMGGPFNALLRSPEMGDLAQQLGAYIRFRTSLPHRLNEMAIIMTARVWTAQYEWYAHKTLALEAGLNPAIVDAIAEGKRPASMQPDEEARLQLLHGAARHQARHRRDVPDGRQGVRRARRRRSDRR